MTTRTIFTAEMLRQVSDIPQSHLSPISATVATGTGTVTRSLQMQGRRSVHAPAIPSLCEIGRLSDSTTFVHLPQLGFVPAEAKSAYLAWLKRDRVRTSDARNAEAVFAAHRQSRGMEVFRGTLAGPVTVKKMRKPRSKRASK